MGKDTKVLDKIRKFGGYMSGMVMPNLGAFVGWGLLAALFIPTGWMPNEKLNEMVGPILNYLLPLLIGYTAGYNIHGQRGGVIGAFTTMGVIVGSDVTMFSGAMIMGPLSSWLLKKIDTALDGKVKPGFEMFVNNFSLGILGFALAIAGYFIIGPIVNAIIVVLTTGIKFLISKKLIPLLAVFMSPAQVLFLNNAVNHGIISPIAYAQAQEAGKSLMFLLDSNCGPSLGTLCAIALFGKGKAKETAPMAMFIAGIAGIGEVYFPFVLANPVMIVATMGGMATSLFLLVVLGGGLVGMPSPGSLINIALMTPKDAALANLIAIAAGFAVALLIGTFLLMLPLSSKTGKVTGIVDALFTSTTSVCVTGLVTVPTYAHWSLFGQVVIALLAQVGGLGVITFTTMFMLILRRRIGMKERLLIQDAYNLDTIQGLVVLVKKILKGTLVVETVGALLYMTVFIPDYGLA